MHTDKLSFFKIMFSSLLLIILTSCQSLSPDSNKSWLDKPLPLSEKVITGQFDNGMRYYFRPNHKPEQRAYITLLINVGSMQEQENELGAAHYVEHMAFNGSTHFKKQQLIDTLESLGMEFGSDINAFTSQDSTRFHLEIPTDNPQNWQTINKILQDWIRGISFDEQEVEQERQVILSERRNYTGLAERVKDSLNQLNYGNSRRGKRSPIGTEESLKLMTKQDLVGFYQKWYQPHNMALIITGDIQTKPLFETFNQTIGQISNTSQARPQEYPVSDKTLAVDIIQDQEILSESLQVRLLGEPVEALTNYSSFRQQLIQSISLSLFNQRLNELISNGIKPFESAAIGASNFDGFKNIYNLSIRPIEGKLDSGYQRLLLEIERVKQHGYLANELSRYTKELLKTALLSYQDQDSTHSSNLTGQYMSHFLNQTHYLSRRQRLTLLKEIIPTISLEDLHQQFNKIINSKPHSAVIFAPQSKKYSDNFVSQFVDKLQQSSTQVTAYAESDLQRPLLNTLPIKGSIVKSELINQVDGKRFYLSNGAKVIIRPSQLAHSEILISAYSAGGYSLAPLEIQRSAMESAKLVAASGIGPYSRSDLGKKLSEKQVRIQLHMGRYYASLNASSTLEDFETLMQLLHLYFTAPKIDTQVTANYRQSVKQYQKNRLNDPEQKFYDELHLRLFNNHPRSQPWSVQLAETIEQEAALEFYKQRFSKANNFTFVIVGNIDQQTIEPLLEQYIASLPAAEQTENWQDEAITLPEQDIQFSRNSSLDEQTKVSLRYHKKIKKYRDGSRFQLGFFAELLEQELQKTLREELGGVYSVSVADSISRVPNQWFNLTISFNCDPEREKELIAATEKILQQALNKPFSDLELNKIKKQHRIGFEESKLNNSFWLGQIYFYERDKIDYQYFATYLDRLEKINTTEILNNAKQLFKNSHRIESVLAPIASP